MFDLTDLHAHMPSSPEELTAAEVSLDAAYRDGVRAIRYTCRAALGESRAESAIFRQLQEHARQAYPALTLRTGWEILFPDCLGGSPGIERLPTIGGSGVLQVCFSETIAPQELYRALMTLRTRGYAVLLAHAEEIECLLSRPSLARMLADAGVLLEVDAGAVLGERGLRARGFCRRMLKEDMIHAIASGEDVSRRPESLLARCRHYVARHFGEALAYRLFCYAPASLLGLRDPEDLAAAEQFLTEQGGALLL